MSVKPIPDGYHTATPYLIVGDAAAALDFYKKAFGAEELVRLNHPGGKVMHSEFKVGDSRVMLSDEFPDMGFKGPESLGGSPVSIMLYVEDVDAAFKRAIDAGATEARPVENQFYGDRVGWLNDPFGYTWTVATHVEDVSEEEIGRRFQEMMEKGECE